MSESPFIAEATLATFDALVLERSHEVPVLVDFWADWCGPCKVLMPILAKLANEYAGKFLLVKVDTDEEQKLAGKFGIRGLPTVKMFVKGEMVQEFSGAQPERTVRQLLDKYIERASDTAAQAALAQITAGNIEAGIAALRAALQQDPGNDRVKLKLARALMDNGELSDSEQVLRSLSIEAHNGAEAQSLIARRKFLSIAADAPPLTALEQAVAQSPENSEASFQLAARYMLQDAFEPAMEQLLAIVRRDRKFRDDAARKSMLLAFNLAGSTSEVVKKYRSLLSVALN